MEGLAFDLNLPILGNTFLVYPLEDHWYQTEPENGLHKSESSSNAKLPQRKSELCWNICTFLHGTAIAFWILDDGAWKTAGAEASICAGAAAAWIQQYCKMTAGLPSAISSRWNFSGLNLRWRFLPFLVVFMVCVFVVAFVSLHFPSCGQAIDETPTNLRCVTFGSWIMVPRIISLWPATWAWCPAWTDSVHTGQSSTGTSNQKVSRYRLAQPNHCRQNCAIVAYLCARP